MNKTALDGKRQQPPLLFPTLVDFNSATVLDVNRVRAGLESLALWQRERFYNHKKSVGELQKIIQQRR